MLNKTKLTKWELRYFVYRLENNEFLPNLLISIFKLVNLTV